MKIEVVDVRRILPFLFVCGAALVAPARAQLDPPDLWELVRTPALAPFVANGSIAWGDYDRDGLFDVYLIGRRTTSDGSSPYAQLFLNDGDYFLPDPAGEEGDEPATRYLPRLFPTDPRLPIGFYAWRGSVAWADFDGDGYLDLAATGIAPTGLRHTRIYRSTLRVAAGDLLRLESVQATGLSDGDIAWGDYDNDGDLDLVYSGLNAGGLPRTRILQNRVREGLGFQELVTGLADVWQGDLAWGDYDNDMDLDLLLAGVNQAGEFLTRVYRNDGSGAFTDANAGLPGYLNASVDWGDGDADGDLDIVQTGASISPFLASGNVFVYRNDGGSFTTAGTSILGRFGEPGRGRYGGDARWGDFNNDGLLDFFITGYESPISTESGRTYENEGDMSFVYSTVGFHNGTFRGGGYGRTEWGDYDGDNDLDILTMGRDSGGNVYSESYRNYLPVYQPNSIPEAPTGLAAEVSGSSVTLSWQAGTDGFAPPAALTYNVRVGSFPGADDIMPSMTMPDGRRLISAMGNAGHNLGWRLQNLPQGTYYWTVQTIDTSFAGSAFAVEETFTIPALSPNQGR